MNFYLFKISILKIYIYFTVQIPKDCIYMQLRIFLKHYEIIFSKKNEVHVSNKSVLAKLYNLALVGYDNSFIITYKLSYLKHLTERGFDFCQVENYPA